MGKLQAFQFPGLRLWFCSDDHLPPHFHAEKRSEWEIRVMFLKDPYEMCEVRWAIRQPSSRMLRSIAAAARAHATELLAEWKRKVNVTDPRPEE